MATSTPLQVRETQARKLFKELNDSTGVKASPKRLAKKLVNFAQELNGESVEDLDLSSASKSLVEEVVEAVDDDREVEIAGEEEDVDETPSRSRKAKTKTKTKVKAKKTKTRVSGKKATKKKGKKSGSYTPPSQEYLDRKKDEGERLLKIIEKHSPISISEAAKRAKVPESRVQSHVNYRNRGRKGGFYKVDKKGRISRVDD
jgi:hypothetical protein